MELRFVVLYMSARTPSPSKLTSYLVVNSSQGRSEHEKEGVRRKFYWCVQKRNGHTTLF